MKKAKTKIKRLTKRFHKKLSRLLHKPRAHRSKQHLHTIEWIFVLLAFFVIGFAVIYHQNYMFFLVEEDVFPPGSKEALIQTPEEQKMFTGEVVPEPVDTTSWDTYQNKWYGFEIQHPDSWTDNTQYKTATEKSARYETIYKFRRDGAEEDDTFEGYDVKIYQVKRAPNIESTNDIHEKEGAPEDTGECAFAEETDFGPEGYNFKKVSIKEDNPCFEPAYFYSVTKGSYIYNIVPAVGESGERFSEPERETTRLFPEYKEAVVSLKFISIVRPKPKPDPRVGVRRPVAAKVVGGKLVCAKKNDHPKDSDKNKPGHLDLECCLDPDERPNPWCSY